MFRKEIFKTSSHGRKENGNRTSKTSDNRNARFMVHNNNSSEFPEAGSVSDMKKRIVNVGREHNG